MGSGWQEKEWDKNPKKWKAPPGIANDYSKQMQGIRGNGVNASTGLGKVETNIGPSREAKQKLSPPRVINKAQLASSLQTIRTDTHAQAQIPMDVSPKILDLDNMGFRVGDEAVQIKPNLKASVKSKKVIARVRASQDFVIGAMEKDHSSSIVHSQKEKRTPFSSGDQVNCDGGGKPRSGEESKPRVAS